MRKEKALRRFDVFSRSDSSEGEDVRRGLREGKVWRECRGLDGEMDDFTGGHLSRHSLTWSEDACGGDFSSTTKPLEDSTYGLIHLCHIKSTNGAEIPVLNFLVNEVDAYVVGVNLLFFVVINLYDFWVLMSVVHFHIVLVVTRTCA
jgi:hypothetical protein